MRDIRFGAATTVLSFHSITGLGRVNLESVEINGVIYEIRRISSANRTASARLRGHAIVLSIPSRWPNQEKERVSANLLRRAIRSIEKGRWKEEQGGKVAFSHGQKVVAMGRPLDIVFQSAKRFGSKVMGDTVMVRVVEGHPKKADIASALARKRIADTTMPLLLKRVRHLNDLHFGANVPKLAIRDNSTRWGSCSRDGSISLNFRLLFMPQDVLDYVIIHELAHTRYRSHGVRFWALVERIMPDHKEKRRWLRENGWAHPPNPAIAASRPEEGGQRTPAGFDFEEPY